MHGGAQEVLRVLLSIPEWRIRHVMSYHDIVVYYSRLYVLCAFLT
jgi:hypothetical protein